MRFLKNLLLLLLVLAAALLGVAFALPKTAHVERTITIQRHASQVFAVLDSYRRFNEWSPWASKDPHAQYTISGPVSGVGAKLAWVGDPRSVGSGSQEIVAAAPNQSVTTALNFDQTMQARAQFLLTPDNGSGTKLVWTFDAELPLEFDGKIVWNALGRYMGLMMDRMIGPDYEQGLGRLKVLIEGLPAADISGVQGEPVERAAQKIYYVAAQSATDAESAKTVLTGAYAKLGTFLSANGIAMAGAPMTITDSYDAAGGWKFDAAVPVDRNDAPGDAEVKSGETYHGKAVQFVHVGPYDKIGDTLQKAYAWLAVLGYKTQDRLIEEYISDPGNTPVDQLKTRLVIPVQ